MATTSSNRLKLHQPSRLQGPCLSAASLLLTGLSRPFRHGNFNKLLVLLQVMTSSLFVSTSFTYESGDNMLRICFLKLYVCL